MIDGMEQESIHLSCKNDKVWWFSGPAKEPPLSQREPFPKHACLEGQASVLIVVCDRELTLASV